jgi:hypothetical protein
VQRYTRAFCSGVWRFRTDPAFGIDLLRKYTREPDRAVLESTWVLFARYMGGLMFPSVEGVRNAGHVLHRLGAVPRQISPYDYIDLEPVAELEREGFFREMMGLPRAVAA